MGFKALQLLIDQTAKCDAVPSLLRALGVFILWWRGKPYLVCNTGNGLMIFDISDPLAPKYVSGSAKLTRGFAGDRDYNLMQFSVADNCRFALASFPGSGAWSQHMGQTLIDLGDGSKPQIRAWRQYPSDTPQPEGGCVFSISGQAYVLANGLPNGSPASLYALDGIAPDDLTFLQAVPRGDGSPLNVAWGQIIGSCIYAFDTSGIGHVYTVSGSGTDLRLTYHSSPFHAGFTYSHGFSYDPATMTGATASGSSVSVWDLHDPASPQLISDIVLLHRVTSVAIGGGLLWVACKGSAGTANTFNISDPEHMFEIEADFWEPGHPWNEIGGCFYEHDAAFSPDGRALYRAAYSGLQIIDTQQPATTHTGGDPVPTKPPNVTPDPEVTPTPTPAPETEPVPVHGHIDPGFNPPPGAGECYLTAKPATAKIGQKVLLAASGITGKVVSCDFFYGGPGCFGWIGQHSKPGLDGAGTYAEARYAELGWYTAQVIVHTEDGDLYGSCPVTVTADGACPAEPDKLYPPRSPILADQAETPAPAAPTPEPVAPGPVVEPTPATRPDSVVVVIETTARWDESMHAYVVTLG